MVRIAVIDNYDSFVWNIVTYLAEIGAEVDVWRNDDPRFCSPDWYTAFDGVLVSPGPGTPEAAGVSVAAIRSLAGIVPVFGVCLGLQAMAVAFGGRVGRAGTVVHGKVSAINHDGRGVFAGLPSPLRVTRYHSLAIEEGSLPDCLEVSARSEDGTIMAIRHRRLPLESVQFHPESVLTEGGHRMLAAWLAACGDADAPLRARGLAPLVSAPEFSAAGRR